MYCFSRDLEAPSLTVDFHRSALDPQDYLSSLDKQTSGPVAIWRGFSALGGNSDTPMPISPFVPFTLTLSSTCVSFTAGTARRRWLIAAQSRRPES